MINMAFDYGLANSNQIEAISTTEGPLLIIAGPGTGKTFTLIKRIMYLIRVKNVEPENIMIVTFTEKAAKELLTRLSNELMSNDIHINLNEMYVGTIHSVCLKIIKENIEYSKMRRNFKVYDDFDQQYFLYQNYWSSFNNIEDIDLVIEPKGSIWDRTSKLKKYINLISEELIDVEKLLNSEKKEALVIGKILSKYQSLREKHNFIDFTTIQVELHEMLTNVDSSVLKKIQEKIRYVMVDEYQDTNYIQEQIVFLISGKNNLCVVGDDDQGLYRFRGATIRNILEFENNFDYCKKVVLNKNYRSEKDIIDFYNNFIQTTEGRDFEFEWENYRINKKIQASKINQGTFQSTGKITAEDYDELNQKVLEFIQKLKEESKITNYNQIAFLFRSVKNDKVISLAKHLEENGVSVYSPRSNLFFERTEIKLLIGTLLLMFPTFINEMKSNQKSWMESLYSYYHECMTHTVAELKKTDNHDIARFVRVKARDHILLPDQKKGVDYSIGQLIYQLFQFKLFADIVTVDLKDGLKDSMKSRNIAIFIKYVSKYEFNNDVTILTPKNINYTVNKLFSEFLSFLYEGGITEFEDDSEYAPSGSVSFLTIHQSKGMEFPIVLVDSLFSVPREDLDDMLMFVEDNFSRRKSFEPRESIKFFDFWRLYYTAFSRAKELLILFGAKSSRGISKYFESHIDSLIEYNDFQNLKASEIKTAQIKKTYSFTTDVEVYETSQIEYLFFKELGYTRLSYGAAIFGQLVHTTIEDIHKAVINGDKEHIDKDKINQWMMINYDSISRAEKNYLSPRFLNEAYQQILSYYEKRESNWESIKEAEIPISIVKENYILTGKVDLLQSENGEYEIIDFKTEKKPDIFKEKERIEKSKMQLEIYAYILEERYGLNISKLKIYYTSEQNSNPIIEFKKDNKSIHETIKYFDNIIKKIENKEFDNSPEKNRINRNSDLRYYLKIV